jgi:sensor c-di-GMP phosphodiesterase-like protein
MSTSWLVVGAAICTVGVSAIWVLVYARYTKLAWIVSLAITLSIAIISMWGHWPLSNESWVWSGGGLLAGIVMAGAVLYLRRRLNTFRGK